MGGDDGPEEEEGGAHRARVSEELLASERRYLTGVTLLLSAVVRPLEQVAQTRSLSVLEEPHVAVLFSSLAQVETLTAAFVRDLGAAVHEGDGIAAVFVRYAPLFRSYALYSKNHTAAVSFLADCRERAYLDTVEAAAPALAAAGATLDGLLIAPVQRVPRFVLLLRELQRSTPEADPARAGVDAALAKVSGYAAEVNEAIRASEEHARLVELERRFAAGGPAPALRDPSFRRRLVREGELRRRTRHGLRPFVFHLLTDLLLYSERAAGGRLRLHRRIELRTCVVTDRPHSDDEPHPFMVHSSEKSFVVSCASEQEKAEWLADVAAALSDAVGRADEEAAAGAAAPVWQSSKGTHCSRCFTRFTAIRRRHHCRKCGSLVCGACATGRRVVRAVDPRQTVRVCDRCLDTVAEESMARPPPRAAAHAPQVSLSSLGLPPPQLVERDRSVTARLSGDALASERVYLERLGLLVGVFVRPLLTAMTARGGQHELDGRQVPGELTLFLHSVEPLLSLHAELAAALSAAAAKPDSRLGELFVRFAPLFSVYEAYARHHFRAVRALEDTFAERVSQLEGDQRLHDYFDRQQDEMRRRRGADSLVERLAQASAAATAPPEPGAKRFSIFQTLRAADVDGGAARAHVERVLSRDGAPPLSRGNSAETAAAFSPAAAGPASPGPAAGGAGMAALSLAEGGPAAPQDAASFGGGGGGDLFGDVVSDAAGLEWGVSLVRLLHQPLLRLVEYEDLLSRLLDQCPAGGSGREGAEETLAAMRGVSIAVKRALVRHQNVQKLQALERRLVSHSKHVDDDALRLVPAAGQPERFFIREGWLSRVTRRGQRPFYFVLCSDVLLYCEGVTLPAGGLRVNRRLRLATAHLLPREGLAIEFRSPTKSFVAWAAAEAEKRAWVADIGESIEAARDTLPSNAGEIAVSPVWVPNAEASACGLCSSSFGVFRRRHHCRNCGGLVCGKCSASRRLLPHIHPESRLRVCDRCDARLESGLASASANALSLYAAAAAGVGLEAGGASKAAGGAGAAASEEQAVARPGPGEQEQRQEAEADEWDGDVEMATAVYAYAGGNAENELTLDAGERVAVTTKEGEWWFGSCGGRAGWFPADFVRLDSDDWAP